MEEGTRTFVGRSDYIPTTKFLKFNLLPGDGTPGCIQYTEIDGENPYLKELWLNRRVELDDSGKRYGPTFPHAEFPHLTNDR
jgi:hypothetical protein